MNTDIYVKTKNVYIGEQTMISIETHFLMILFIIFLIFMLGFLFGMCFIADKEENYKLKFKGFKNENKM